MTRTIVPVVATSLSISRASHRLLPGDPDKYITRCRNGFKVRPWRDGQRYYLGIFRTRQAAQVARSEFFTNKRPPLPKFVRRLKNGAVRVEVYLGGERYWIPCTPENAAITVYQHLVDVLGEPAAKEAMARK